MKATQFQEGYILLIDKPKTWSSFDVVNKLRWQLKRKLQVKKIKVGHAGTLDPLATGLLVLCTGKYTKKIEDLTADHKIYTGTILLGKTTPSYDLETAYDAELPTGHISTDMIDEARESFLGKQLQTPPVFSAKQIDGKRAYEFARAGEAVELKQNEIEIFDFAVDSSEFPKVHFSIKCSKGTYIRSIASDFGKALNSGGTLVELRRTGSGAFDIEDALTVDEAIKMIEESEI
ncbi:MAG: tRNA pseudouridine(55) synthase TruB [Crocinitomicaceae bacterium]|nr:tRNA pseudouridine(55) synthase TruB [Crocinitomicaceae bacterium]